MARRLVVVGAGGFGRETLDVVEAIANADGSKAWDVLGVVDDAPSTINLSRLADRGVPYLGTLDDIPDGAVVTVGIGAPAARRAICQKLEPRALEYATLVHPSADVGTETKVGSGAVICAGVSVGTNSTLGRHVHLNPHVVVGHDAILEDFVSVNPNATVSGDCVVCTRVLIGAGSVVLQGLTVGAGAVVGAAACVTRDVQSESVVKGVPAR